MDINELGKKLVSCKLSCEGILNDSAKGIIPRCLNFEERGSGKGAIVVGLNPGKGKLNDKERAFYINHNNSYTATREYWAKALYDHPYHKRTRKILSEFEYNGDILWTELVKCECSGENGILPISTMRICINRFLKKEIEEIFPNYTIFALGNKAFDFCALSFPNHFVVGLPHPTGSYGMFPKLCNRVIENKQKYIDILSNTIDNNGNYRAIKL